MTDEQEQGKWTRKNLLHFLLYQGGNVHICEGCGIEDACEKTKYYCRPLYRLFVELGVVESGIEVRINERQ